MLSCRVDPQKPFCHAAAVRNHCYFGPARVRAHNCGARAPAMRQHSLLPSWRCPACATRLVSPNLAPTSAPQTTRQRISGKAPPTSTKEGHYNQCFLCCTTATRIQVAARSHEHCPSLAAVRSQVQAASPTLCDGCISAGFMMRTAFQSEAKQNRQRRRKPCTRLTRHGANGRASHGNHLHFVMRSSCQIFQTSS